MVAQGGELVKTIIKNAYAKVNLALDVLGKRPDGYHEVSMVMQNLSLHDTLTFEADYADDVDIKLTCNRNDIPLNENNLVYKAILLMFDKYNIKAHINVHIDKQIPVEAGMAGGSTDCAACFHAINELFEIEADLDTLMKLGVTLGADVPYCIMGCTALSEGIGEVLTPVTPLTDCYVLVAKPPISVSTGMVYKSLDAKEICEHPDVAGMVGALERGSIQDVAEHMANVLESVTVELHPEIEILKDIMKEQGALNAIMSGSGPTVFGLYEDKAAADKAAAYIGDKGLSTEIYVTKPVSGGAEK